jgi:hypothetical protein
MKLYYSSNVYSVIYRNYMNIYYVFLSTQIYGSTVSAMDERSSVFLFLLRLFKGTYFCHIN